MPLFDLMVILRKVSRLNDHVCFLFLESQPLCPLSENSTEVSIACSMHAPDQKVHSCTKLDETQVMKILGKSVLGWNRVIFRVCSMLFH